MKRFHIRIIGHANTVTFTARDSRNVDSMLDAHMLKGFVRINGLTVSGYIDNPLSIGLATFIPTGANRRIFGKGV